MAEPSDETLAGWMAAVTVSTDPLPVKLVQSALKYVLAQSTPQGILDLVAIAHARGDAAAREALGTLIKVEYEHFLMAGNDGLLECLACAAVVRSLAAADKHATLVGLAVECAEWVGLNPARPEVREFAAQALADASVAARSRHEWEPIAEDVVSLLRGEEAQVNAEGVTEQESAEGHEAAIERLAEALDEMGARMDDRLRLVDEEYDALWWSYASRSDVDGDSWDSVCPAELRAVRVAHELGDKLTRSPAPPMVRGLIAQALGDMREKTVSLQELTKQAVTAAVAVCTDAEHLLLPISSAVATSAMFDGDDTLWPTALEKRFGIDASRSSTAMAGALQLIRENQMGDILG